uniref:Oxidoreductase, short chain dehydrogenase/reductase family protein n=1 Tax=mine drainage metagenome TaxID=410659 RepID=E6PXI7_9ZZZZ
MANEKDFQGRWALVTGASAGIGVALARELARHGAKLILTARRRDRLEALAEELLQQGTEVRIVEADLTDSTAPQAIYNATEGAGLAVEILVNNAGLGQFGEFAYSHLEQELRQVRVNCEAVVHLSRLFVPAMVARRRGWVLIVASTASFQPVPFLSTYAATKGFDRFFALGLAEEVAPDGVTVTALCPGPTESEFFDIAGAAQFKARGMQSAEAVARRGVHALAAGERTIIPYFAGRVTAFLVRFLPSRAITWAVAKAARPAARAQAG